MIPLQGFGRTTQGTGGVAESIIADAETAPRLYGSGLRSKRFIHGKNLLIPLLRRARAAKGMTDIAESAVADRQIAPLLCVSGL